MTDFVSRLLGVADAGSPPIRPLTGSLFEPRQARHPAQDQLPVPGGSTGSPAVPLTDPVGARSAAPAGPGRSAGAPGRGQAADPPGQRRAPAGRPGPEERSAALPGHRPQAPGEVPPPSVGGTVPPAARPSGGPEASDRARPADGRHRADGHRPAGALRRGSAAAADPAAGPTIDPTADPATDPTTDPVTGPVTEPVREHPVRPLHTAQRPPEPAPAAPWPQRRQGPAAGPTVHITIGRVEVRAPRETPAPAPRRPERQPATSLDEYLRTRSGGDRR